MNDLPDDHCYECKGSGQVQNGDYGWTECWACGGTGKSQPDVGPPTGDKPMKDDELSPDEQDLLLLRTLEAGLPPEATDHFRKTFAWQRALLNHRAKKLVREVITQFGFDRRN